MQNFNSGLSNAVQVINKADSDVANIAKDVEQLFGDVFTG